MMFKKFLVAVGILCAPALSFALSPYWSNSLSTTTGLSTVIETGTWEIRQSTGTNIRRFYVDNFGNMEDYGSLKLSTGPAGRFYVKFSSSTGAFDAWNVSIASDVLNAPNFTSNQSTITTLTSPKFFFTQSTGTNLTLSSLYTNSLIDSRGPTGAISSISNLASQTSLLVENNSNSAVMAIVTGSSNAASTISFGDKFNAQIGQITYDHGTDSMVFGTSDSNKVFLTANGFVGIGISNPSEFVHLSTGNIRIGTTFGFFQNGATIETRVGGNYNKLNFRPNDLSNDGILTIDYTTGNIGISCTTPSGFGGTKNLIITGSAPSLILGDTDGTVWEWSSNSNQLGLTNRTVSLGFNPILVDGPTGSTTLSTTTFNNPNGSSISIKPGSGANQFLVGTSDGNNWIRGRTNGDVIASLGDFAITTTSKGLVLKSTNDASCWRVTVNSAGTLATASVTCP